MSNKDDKDTITLSKKKLIGALAGGVLTALALVGAIEKSYLRAKLEPNTGQFRESLEDLSNNAIVSDGTEGVLSEEQIDTLSQLYDDFFSLSEGELLKKYNLQDFEELLKLGDEVDEDNASLDTMLKSIFWKEQQYWFIISKKDKNIQAIKCDIFGREYGEENMVEIPCDKLFAGIDMGDYYLIEYDFTNKSYALISKDDVEVNIISVYKTKKALKVKTDSLSEYELPEGSEIQMIKDLVIFSIDDTEYTVNKQQIIDQLKDPKTDLEALPKQSRYVYAKTMSEFHMKGNPNDTFLGGEFYYDSSLRGLYVNAYSLTKGFGKKIEKSNLIETGTNVAIREDLDLATGYAGDEDTSTTNNYIDISNLNTADKGIIEENKGNLLNIFDIKNKDATINFKGAKYNINWYLLDPNVSPARSLEKIVGPKKFMVHDTADHGASAEAIGDYFKNRAPDKYGNPRDVASHFGLDFTTGDVYIYIPPTEKAVAAENMNNDVLHIECTIPQDTVEFTDVEWTNLIDFSARISIIYNIDIDENFIRHCEFQDDRTDPQCMNDTTKEKNERWKEFKEKVKQRKQEILQYQEQAKRIENGQGFNNTVNQNSAIYDIKKNYLAELKSHAGETNKDKKFSKDISNDDIFINWYCARYPAYCAEKTGVSEEVIPRFTNCDDYYNWYGKDGATYENDGSYIPKESDFVFFDYNNDGKLDHMGVVTGVQDGKFATVEGNTGDDNRVRIYDNYPYKIGENNNMKIYFASVDWSKQIENRDYNYGNIKPEKLDLTLKGETLSTTQKKYFLIAYETLIKKGFNHAEALGVVINAFSESRFNPKSVRNAENHSVGFWQWHGGREDNLYNYVKKYNKKHNTNYTWEDIEVQIEYLVSGEKEYGLYTIDNYLGQGFTDSGKAAYWFCVFWEIPANRENQGEERKNMAKIAEEALSRYYEEVRESDIGSR